MDLTDETQFGDFQKEERYKKLQRNLKLARIKQIKVIEETELNLRQKFATNLHLKGSELIQSSSWPSCSSINVDSSDFNCIASPLQTSRIGSEILTSCFHLRNLVPKRSIPSKPMATSSVKQYSEIEQSTNDRVIMPPPSSSHIIRPPTKRSALAVPMPSPIQSQQSSLFSDLSSRGKQPYSVINSSTDYLEDAGCAQDLNKAKLAVRDFYRWRVFLNDQGQLLIKGVLDNGKIARSKPVLKMLSSTKVESIFRHTYCLHGNIVDDKNELPKYVYSKFYNGFPDDWENVHQIWKDYVAQRSRENYRWPMDVSLSDDDLNSEITDVTHQQTIEKKFHESNSMEKSTPQRSSGYCSDIQQERNSRSSKNSSRDPNLKYQSHFFRRNDTAEVLNTSNEKENRSQIENRNQFDNSNDRSHGNLYAALDYAQNLKDIIFEDKLTIITQTLLHENCPKEYARNVNRTIDYLNYLLSYKNRELDESVTKRPRIEYKNDSRTEDFQRNCSTPLFKPDEPILNESKLVSGNEVIQKRSNLELEEQREYKKNPEEVNPQMVTLKMNSDIAESETYAGIPKIPADRIFQSKSYYLRYKEKKFDRNLKSNKVQLNTTGCKNNLVYDSSVSFTEEEIQKHYEDDNSKTRLNSSTLQCRLNVSGSRTDRFNEDTNPDTLRQNRETGNRAPLEVLRKAYFEENRTRIKSPNKTSISNTSPSSTGNEKRKSLIDKENMESNKQTDLSDLSQLKEIPNLQNLDSNSDRRKQKPTIISSEIVNLLHRSKRSPKNQFLSNESDVNKQEQREKEGRSISDTLLKTTEGFQDSKKNTTGNIQENSSNFSFGSEKNPKPLESWIPLVTFDGKEYHLVFEGILLNAVGRPMKKKFTSKHVVRRVSSTVIETADHQFFKLVGDLHNTKHIVPKELLPQCRNGCPAKIDHFCATWLKLRGENNAVVERSQKTTTEYPKNIPTSSRGRRILPPLSFWADERIIRKDNNAFYKPGDPKDDFVTSAIGSPKKPRNTQNQENQTDPSKNSEKKSGSKKVDKKLNTNTLNEEHVSSNEAIQGSSNSERSKRPVKSKIAHKLTFSSSDSEDVQENINTRLKRKSRKSVDFNETSSRNGRKLTQQSQNSRNSNPYGLRKRQKIEVDTDIEIDSDSIPGDKVEKKKLSRKGRTSQAVRCTYHRKIPDRNTTLSDDQASIA